MLKKVFNDGIIYSIPDLLNRGIRLILIPFYTKVFTPADYGVIDIFAVVASLVYLSVAFEISQAIARFYPELEDPLERKIYASTAMIFTFVCYLIFGLIMLLLPDYFGTKILGNSYQKIIYIIAILSIILEGVSKYFLMQLRFQFRAKAYASVITLKILTFTVVVIYLVFVKNVGVVGTFYAGLGSAIVSMLFAYILSIKDYALVFSKAKLIKLLKFSIPIVPASVTVFLSLFTDRIMIKEMLTFNELGLYGIAFRFASVITLIVAGFNTALTPLIYKLYKKESTKEGLIKLLNIFLFLSGGISGFFFLYPKEVLTLLTSTEYVEAWPLIGILAATVTVSNLYIFTPGAAIARKTIHIFIANAIGAILNIVFNYFLIQIWGITGAAISTFISAVFVFGYYYISSQKYYYIPFEHKQLLKFCLIFSFFVIVSYWINLSLSFRFDFLFYKFLFFFLFIGVIIKVLVKDWKSYYNKICKYILP